MWNSKKIFFFCSKNINRTWEFQLTLRLESIVNVKKKNSTSPCNVSTLEQTNYIYLPPIFGVQDTRDCHTIREMFLVPKLTKADSKASLEACIVNCVLLNLNTFGCQQSTNAS